MAAAVCEEKTSGSSNPNRLLVCKLPFVLSVVPAYRSPAREPKAGFHRCPEFPPFDGRPRHILPAATSAYHPTLFGKPTLLVRLNNVRQMKPTIVAILALLLSSALLGDERVILARFELMAVADIEEVGTPHPRKAVVFYRSPVGTAPLAEFVNVEVIDGQNVSTHRLTPWATGRLLDAFEAAQLPEIDYQKHFKQLQNAFPESRRGLARLERGGAYQVKIELHTRNRTIGFELWSPNLVFYGHPSDAVGSAVYRLIEECICAIGSDRIFL